MNYTRQQALYEELERRFGPRIAEAFREAVEDIQRAADVERAITALAVGDIEAALAAMHIDAAAFNPVADAIRETFSAGGQMGVATMPPLVDAAGASLVIRYNGRALGAEAWLRDHSSRLITRTVEDQRRAIRSALEDSLRRGQNPRATIPQIVGRYDPKTRGRVGGIIGLTAPQERWVEKAWAELASADPAALNNYLGRKSRDKTYDRAVKRALADGKALPPDVARKALEGYQSGLLRTRGAAISQTEVLTSLNAGKFRAYIQATEYGNLDPETATKVWRDSSDKRVRHTHAILDGQSVKLLEPFRSASGALMMHPGDTSLGAGADEVVLCRCRFDVRIDRLANLR
jgi:hypothetical protein